MGGAEVGSRRRARNNDVRREGGGAEQTQENGTSNISEKKGGGEIGPFSAEADNDAESIFSKRKHRDGDVCGGWC